MNGKVQEFWFGPGSGDGPLRIRVRPSSLKRDRDRRAPVQASTGKTCLVTVHAKSRLTLETTADTPLRNQGPGRSLPGPDAGHPLQGVGGHGGSIHDLEYARNDLGHPRDE